MLIWSKNCQTPRFTKSEKPLYLLIQDDYRQKKKLMLPLPFPIFDLLYSAHAAHLLVSAQMNNCLPKQLLPCNWITGEENRCYPNSLLPGNLWHRSIILSAQITCTMLIIIYSPKIYNLHYSNSPGYQNFFLEFRSSSFRMTFQFRHFQFGAFVSNFYAEFLRIKFKLGRFSRLCFDYFELSFEINFLWLDNDILSFF